MNALVICAQLQFPARAANRQAFDLGAIRQAHLQADRRHPAAASPLLKRAHEAHQRSRLGLRQLLEGRHAFERYAVTNDQPEFFIVPGGQGWQDGRRVFAAVTVGAVTPRAAALKGGPAIGRLRQRD